MTLDSRSQKCVKIIQNNTLVMIINQTGQRDRMI